MPAFTDYTDILPDPVNTIGYAGQAGGIAGPGFAKVKFTSGYQNQISRTRSGRGVTASPGYHTWEFSISYNPITRAEFEPVSTFLESREARRYPFYVILPQHNAPQDSVFATFCATNTITLANQHTAGSSTLLLSVGTTAGNPRPGDFINIVDGTDVNHKKAYKITRVETNADYKTGTTQPSTTQRRIHITPSLTRTSASGATVRFLNPMFRVVQKGDTIEYDLDTDNLYQFSLNLEEILP